MLTHRTNVLLSEEEHVLLEMLSQKKQMSKGAVIRLALQKMFPQSKKDVKFLKRKKALQKIKAMRSYWVKDAEPTDWKELRDHGRKY